MRPVVLYFVTKLCHLLPETRCWGMKRRLYAFAGVHLGKGVRICSSATILGNGALSIGEDTWIGPGNLIVASERISIGSCCDIAPRCYIGSGTHEIDPVGPHSAGKGIGLPVVIGDGCWIGAGSIILPGCSVGRKSIIAAGAVAKGAIPDGQVWGGCPARFLKNL